MARESLKTPALVLASVPYQETGRIVRLLTPEHGRVSLFAAGAANSRKRFGGALEPMSFVEAEWKAPRETGEAGKLGALLRADIRDPFLHLRTRSDLLESGIFAVKWIDECLPEGESDAAIFRATGRFLRDLSLCQDPANVTAWARLAFWNWTSKHLGFGDVAAEIPALIEQLPPNARRPWTRLMEQNDADFAAFFREFQVAREGRLRRKDESAYYRRWTETSGLHWPHFEQWMNQEGVFV